MNPEDFITFAGKLAEGSSRTNAAYRTAVSRAYYGAFNLVLSLLADIDFGKRGEVHEKLRTNLLECEHGEAINVARILEDLHHGRRRADYNMADDEIGTQDAADEHHRMAQDVISSLAICRRADELMQIKAGILRYQKKIPNRR